MQESGLLPPSRFAALFYLAPRCEVISPCFQHVIPVKESYSGFHGTLTFAHLFCLHKLYNQDVKVFCVSSSQSTLCGHMLSFVSPLAFVLFWEAKHRLSVILSRGLKSNLLSTQHECNRSSEHHYKPVRGMLYAYAEPSSVLHAWLTKSIPR